MSAERARIYNRTSHRLRAAWFLTRTTLTSFSTKSPAAIRRDRTNYRPPLRCASRGGFVVVTSPPIRPLVWFLGSIAREASIDRATIKRVGSPVCKLNSSHERNGIFSRRASAGLRELPIVTFPLKVTTRRWVGRTILKKGSLRRCCIANARALARKTEGMRCPLDRNLRRFSPVDNTFVVTLTALTIAISRMIWLQPELRNPPDLYTSRHMANDTDGNPQAA
jgi:hypothetical protein